VELLAGLEMNVSKHLRFLSLQGPTASGLMWKGHT
jgi:hypothetical protein